MILRSFLFLMMVACVCASSAMAQPSYVVTDLGTLGGKFSSAEAINDAGQVAGYSSTTATHDNGIPVTHGFLWQQGKMLDLGSLPNFPDSRASDVNNKGQVLVNASGLPQRVGNTTTTMSPAGPAFIWKNGAKKELSVADHPSQVIANRINDQEAIAEFHCYGINNKGQKICNRTLATEKLPDGSYTSYLMAVLYDGSNEIDLGTLGGRHSSAHGINDEGKIVGCSATAAKESRAFLWVNGKMVDLGTLPNFPYSSASAINNRGQVVGWLQPAEGEQHAALWQEGKIYDLNTLIPPDSGWLLEIATDVNEKGQIVGHGTVGGVKRAFLLTPKVLRLKGP